MEQQPQPTPQPAEPQEESIFDEELLNSGEYEKHVRYARNAIFAVAAIFLVFGLIESFVGPDEALTISVIIVLFIAGIFAGLGFWAMKNPYPAILIALIFYALIILQNAALDIRTLWKGVIIKVGIIIYLVRGLKNAQEAQRLKEVLGKK